MAIHTVHAGSQKVEVVYDDKDLISEGFFGAGWRPNEQTPHKTYSKIIYDGQPVNRKTWWDWEKPDWDQQDIDQAFQEHKLDPDEYTAPEKIEMAIGNWNLNYYRFQAKGGYMIYFERNGSANVDVMPSGGVGLSRMPLGDGQDGIQLTEHQVGPTIDAGTEL